MREDWIKCKFDDLVEIVSGKNQKDVESNDGEYPIYGSGGIIGRANNYLSRENSTIIGRKGNINSPIYVKEKFWNIDTAFGLESKTILDSKLLYYFCIGYNFKQLDKSTAVPSLAKRDILNIVFPLPPLPEQRAIVAKIKQLFSELDNGIANLKAAQGQLGVYRQAVLKKAFEGGLTRRWRKENNQTKEGWKKETFFDFCKLRRGHDLPLKNIIDGKFPVISSGGIAGYHNEFKANGPALVTGRSGGVGNIHYLECDFYWPHNTVLHVKDFMGNYPKYMYYFFKSFDFKSHSASTAVPTLDRKMLYKLPVRTPTVTEQHQIVQQIESRLSVCDKVEETIAENLQKAEALRQSILKKAFAGELLTDAELTACKKEKDWEPAGELLKRIKKEKN